MENILDVLTVNRDPSESAENGSIVLDIPNNLLFSPWYAKYPYDDTGYVYILVSHLNPWFSYIGQTTNLSKRFRKHQSGCGSFGTSRPEDQPFAIVGYITGLVHFLLQDKLVGTIVDCSICIAEEANQEASANEEMKKMSFVWMIDRDTLVRCKNQIN